MMPEPETSVDVALLVAHSPTTSAVALRELGDNAIENVKQRLEEATGASWFFHAEEPQHLKDDEARRPSDFLDEASLRMVSGPYDAVLVLTDAPLVARPGSVVPGLASPISRVAVLSTHRLRLASRHRPRPALSDPSVRRNAAAVALHLLGHLMGLGHAADEDSPMASVPLELDRREVPNFSTRHHARLARLTQRMPQPRQAQGGPLRSLLFHLASGLRHADELGRALIRNRAPLLPLALPGLATAAVAPALILVFTAEIWDVGLNMADHTAAGFAVVSVLAAAWYLARVQNLFFPRREKRVITEHMAVVNVLIFLTLLGAVIGLFLMVGGLMMIVELYVFPPGLMVTWPTLEDPRVDLGDRVRLAAFISTIGVLTGSLAGGIESRAVIRHLALFLREP